MSAIREDRYFIAGRAVAVSLVHGGPALGCFSKTLFDSLVQGPDMCIPVLDDVADFELYNKIKKVCLKLQYTCFIYLYSSIMLSQIYLKMCSFIKSIASYNNIFYRKLSLKYL